MVDILPKENPEIDKERISRILDIEPDIDTQHDRKQKIYILNGAIYEVPADMTTDHCLELVKLKTIARKRNYSSESSEETSDTTVEKPLFGKKEVIYIDRQEGDSLQKLALTFNCSIAEIKLANKIYNEQELHALRTVKVPVVKDGTLYHEYKEKKEKEIEHENKLGETSSRKRTEETSCGDTDSKYKFRVQKPIGIEPHLTYLSDEDEEYEIYDIRKTETEHLLADRTTFINKTHAGYPVNVCDSTPPDFMNKMDEKIEKHIEELESKSDSLELTTDYDQHVSFPIHRQEDYEKYGSVCSLTWKHFVLVICLVAVVVPTIYFIHFYFRQKQISGQKKSN